ncbi:MAG: lipid-A-disaccharide synthase [Thermodesulfobacteriota bacterium]
MNLFIISGEESGDLLGAELMDALKKHHPDIRVGGMGGVRMRKAGQEGLDSSELSVVGIVEVCEKLFVILNAFKEIKARLKRERPDCVVLIDFPDFNLRVARAARKLGIPVVYYISPQVWAWRRGRVRTIARLVDKMLVVFPFEVDIYKGAGVDVEYVGHPLAGRAVCDLTMEEAKKELGLPDEATVVALLPGSRTGEVKRMLPPLLKAAELVAVDLGRSGREVRFVIPAPASILNTELDACLKESTVEAAVVRGRMYAALRASEAAAVTSGTATLETALIGTPMVIIYRMSPASYRIGRALIGVKHIGLPNIVAGRAVVPELIQNQATAENIARELCLMLRDDSVRASMEEAFGEVRAKLGGGGAPDRAAAAISKFISGLKRI